MQNVEEFSRMRLSHRKAMDIQLNFQHHDNQKLTKEGNLKLITKQSKMIVLALQTIILPFGSMSNAKKNVSELSTPVV